MFFLGKLKFFILILLSVSLIGISNISQARNDGSTINRIARVNFDPKEGNIVDNDNYIAYFPKNILDNNKAKYFPMIAVFSPAGNASFAIEFWRNIADKYQFILYASKIYRNYMPELQPKSGHIYSSIYNFAKEYPVDTGKIIYTGLSGGGSFSYYLNYYIPNAAFALIINTGRIWEEQMYYPIANDIQAANEKMQRKPIVLMLASRTDFRYSFMQRDRDLIAKLGWKFLWLEFDGGHTLAPYPTYYQAIDWLKQQPEWNSGKSP